MVWYRPLLPIFANAWHALAFQPGWAAHAAAVLRLPRLAQDSVQQCLTLISVLAALLPVPEGQRPGRFSWQDGAHAAEVLLSESALQAALASYFEAADGAAISGALSATAQLVQLLPFEPPVLCGDEGRGADGRIAIMALLGGMCGMTDRADSWRRLSSQQQRRVRMQLLPLVSRLPQWLRLVAGGRQLEQLAAEQRTLLLALVTATCSYMFLLRSFWQDYASALSSELHRLPSLAPSSLPEVPEAAAWCSAACGALQSIPLACQLYSICREEPSPARFGETALDTAWIAIDAMKLALSEPSNHAAVAQDGALHDTVWQLHSSVARLVQFSAAAEAPPVRLGRVFEAGKLLNVLTKSLDAAAHLHAVLIQHTAATGGASLQTPR